MASSREKTPSFSRSASLEILPRSALNRILAQTRSSRQYPHIHLSSMKTFLASTASILRYLEVQRPYYTHAQQEQKRRALVFKPRCERSACQSDTGSLWRPKLCYRSRRKVQIPSEKYVSDLGYLETALFALCSVLLQSTL